ncbi:MAG: flagellar basal body L-ring protein FlgH [Pseudomonadota bacterium]
MTRKFALAASLIALVLTSGCASSLWRVGRMPELSAPGGQRPDATKPDEARMAVTLPVRMPEAGATGSLWRSGPESLFGDRRARKRGDILTVLIEIEDEAQILNNTTRSRTGSENISVPALLGANQTVDNFLPEGASLNPAINTNSTSTSVGNGQILREEEINLRLAATVVEVLPNGHLVIVGSQEVRVNYELRDLQVAGIIRPEDISRANTITYDKVADARIAYGGRGQITDIQQPRYGQQIIDAVSPF